MTIPMSPKNTKENDTINFIPSSAVRTLCQMCPPNKAHDIQNKDGDKKTQPDPALQT
jgi:hypothetical protein